MYDHTKQDWDDMISVNLTAPFLASQAVIPHMIKNGKGKIINFGSIASFMGRPDRVGYVAAKSGVLGLTRALSVDQQIMLLLSLRHRSLQLHILPYLVFP